MLMLRASWSISRASSTSHGCSGSRLAAAAVRMWSCDRHREVVSCHHVVTSFVAALFSLRGTETCAERLTVLTKLLIGCEPRRRPLPAEERHLHVSPEEDISDGRQLGGATVHLHALLLRGHLGQVITSPRL